MPTKRNRRVGVQSRKVKKPKNLSRKLSVSGKARKRGSSTHGSSTHGSGAHGSGTRRRVQRGGDLGATIAWSIGVPAVLYALYKIVPPFLRQLESDREQVRRNKIRYGEN